MPLPRAAGAGRTAPTYAAASTESADRSATHASAGLARASRDLERAVDGLRTAAPELSAAEPTWLWQRILFLVTAAALAIGAALTPRATLSALLAVLALPFLWVVALRALALWHAVASHRAGAAAPISASGAALPTYSALVPLFREASVVPSLLDALSALDYPPSKLEILLIVESVDRETIAALAAVPLAPHMRVVTVPDGAPRTKPRALNFALAQSQGERIVVYDAEDVPEPDQLRLAASAISASPATGCVQARLNVYNPNDTWLTRGIRAQTPQEIWPVPA